MQQLTPFLFVSSYILFWIALLDSTSYYYFLEMYQPITEYTNEIFDSVEEDAKAIDIWESKSHLESAFALFTAYILFYLMLIDFVSLF